MHNNTVATVPDSQNGDAASPAPLDKALSFYFGAGASQKLDAVRRARDGDDEPESCSGSFDISSCPGTTEALQLRGCAAAAGEDAADCLTRWSRHQSSHEMSISHDGLTATRAPVAYQGKKSAYVGAVGDMSFSEGRHVFAVRCVQPVDDHYWVGVAYSDCNVSQRTKKNQHCIAWSGGAAGSETAASRPGTLIVHGQKHHSQPQFQHGDVIGVGVCMDTGDLVFFRNGEKVIEWTGVLRASARPYTAMQHTGCASASVAPSGQLLAWQHEDSRHLSGLAGTAQVCNNDDLPHVNGSALEGGGQVLRVSLALAALLKRPLLVHSIRGGRSVPGLRPQHATGCKLIAELCGGTLEPAELLYGGHCDGVSAVRLEPGASAGAAAEQLVADIHSAGSITLMIQAALPCMLLGQSDCTSVEMRGGTNVSFSPPIDFFQFGVPSEAISVQLRKRGFFPRGGGSILLSVQPVRSLLPVQWLERGAAVRIEGIVFGSGTGRRAVKQTRSQVLGGLQQVFGRDLAMSIVTDTSAAALPRIKPVKQQQQQKVTVNDKGGLSFKDRAAMYEERSAQVEGTCGVQLAVHTEHGHIVSANFLVESGRGRAQEITSDEVANGVVRRLREVWAAGGVVDEYTVDQVVIFMALAEGRSSVLCPAPSCISSLHLETAIHFTTLLTGVKFETTELPTRERMIECNGMGWKNPGLG